MMLAERCRHEFARVTEKRGREYFRARRVVYLEVDGQSATAEVSGSSSLNYAVDINWTDAKQNVLHASCTCPHFDDGYLCKHIWAVLLDLDQRKVSESIPGFGELSVESYYADDELDDEAIDEDASMSEAIRAILEKVAPERLKPRSKPVAKGWRQRLQHIRQVTSETLAPVDTAGAGRVRSTQIWYAVNVADSLKSDRVVIDFAQRTLKKDGNWGKFRPYSVSRYDIDNIPDSLDRELISQLTTSDARQSGTHSHGYGYYGFAYSSSFRDSWLTAAMAEMLLPKLCSTGRLIWVLSNDADFDQAPRPTWDEGPTWQLGLKIDSDAQAGEWQIRGQFQRDQETRSLGDAVLVNSRVVLFPDAFARLDGDTSAGWSEVLRVDGVLRIPFDERNEFLASIAELPQAPVADWPSDLTIDAVQGEPGGVLRLTQSKLAYERRYWLAHVHFDYGIEKFGVQDDRGGIFDAESNRLIRRDFDGERKLLDQLDAMTVTRPSSFEYSQTKADRKLHERHLSNVVEAMTRAGWQVEAEGVKVRRPGQVRLSVTSDVDWFELAGSVDFDGASATLPSLLKAVRDDQKYVLLDDGTRGLLPEEWLEKFGRLAELGRADGDMLRFEPSQATLLDALIAAQQQDSVSCDQQFEEFRSRLRAFDGVQPADPPAGFQGTLRGYQREGLGWLHFLREYRLGGCLADDMGLGKTVQVLGLLESRRQERAAKQKLPPSIVVVPKSLIFNWLEEAERFTPELRMMNYTGLGRAALRDQFDRHDVIVTTYGTLRRDIVELKDREFDYAILDESQAIKNAGSQAAKAVRLVNARHRLAMTGTPVENHLGELWSLFEFLNPGMLGRSSVFSSLARGGASDDDGWLKLLAQALRPFMLRRTKRQVLTELPEKTEQTLHCEMSPKERKKYNELRDYYRTQLNDRVAKHGLEKSKIHVLEALLRLRQAACHPGLLDKKKVGETSAKLETLFEQVEEVVSEGHKALVFSQFTSLLSIVRAELDKRKVTYEYLDGRTRKRGDKVKRFQQDPDCPLFLVSLKAGGHGLNLTAADYVFILDPWWNPAVEAQAVDRAHRIGQTRHVFAYRLICKDTVEDKIIELQKSKRELADAIVSADNSLMRSLTAEDLALLFE